MRMRERMRMLTRHDQAGDVRNVRQKKRSDLISDLPEYFEIDETRIGARAGDDQLWIVLFREGADLVVVDESVVVRSI